MSSLDVCATVGCNHRRDEHGPFGCNSGPGCAGNCVEFTEPPTVADRLTKADLEVAAWAVAHLIEKHDYSSIVSRLDGRVDLADLYARLTKEAVRG